MIRTIKYFLLLMIMAAQMEAANIAVLTIAAGDAYIWATGCSLTNKRDYCEKHGYDFYPVTESLDTSRPLPWSKIKLVQRELPKYDWVFWTDADSLVMNDEISLESIIDEDYCLIITRDPLAPINTGQFLLKNCPWSIELLERIYALDHDIYHGWWEQKALIDLLDQDPSLREKIKMVPQRTMNSFDASFNQYWNIPSDYGTYQPGDFIIHFAGVRNLELLRHYMQHYFNAK